MRRLLIDTNVVLDVLLDRQPWVEKSKHVWQAIDDGLINAYITATTLTDIFYIMRKAADKTIAQQALQICLAAFDICPVERTTIEMALTETGDDFEDNTQIACAVQQQLEGIITRDKTGFVNAPIVVMTPEEFIATLPSTQPPQA
jgi:predicted nucleic acid-binding protein